MLISKIQFRTITDHGKTFERCDVWFERCIMTSCNLDEYTERMFRRIAEENGFDIIDTRAEENVSHG